MFSGRIKVRTVWEDGHILAFHHPQTQAEMHVVVIPKERISPLLDPRALDDELLSPMIRAIQQVARELGLGGRINVIMQTAFFKISNIIPLETALKAIKDATQRTYGKKGQKVVAQLFPWR